jgi:superfamily II DNA/RNA helicase
MRQRSCYIHGDVPQERREQYVTEFREGRFNILVATDVASRGLDISNISLILNFDFPRDI